MAISRTKFSIRYWLVATFLSFAFAQGHAANAQEVFNEANQLYQQGNYEKAVEKYALILRGGAYSKELFDNLGNAYFRQNKIGYAILNYERGLKLAPSDAQLRHNLAIAKQKIVENPESPTEVALLRAWRNLQQTVSPDAASVVGLVLIWLGAASAGIWLLGKERRWKKGGFVSALVLLPLSILPFFLSKTIITRAENSEYGVIIVKESALSENAQLSTSPISAVHEGVKVLILEETTTATYIQLENGEMGWIPENAVERI